MKLTFEQFYTELQKNEPWFDQMKLRYFRKDLKDVANQCYIFLLASEQRWNAQDYQDFRKCYQSFLSNAKDRVTAPSLQQEEVKLVTHSEPILTGEERDKKIAEWLESVKAVKMANPVPKLSRKQIAEEGDWLPKKGPTHPSTSEGELKKAFFHQYYIKHNFDPRTADKVTGWVEETRWIEDNEVELMELWTEELSRQVIKI